MSMTTEAEVLEQGRKLEQDIRDTQRKWGIRKTTESELVEGLTGARPRKVQPSAKAEKRESFAESISDSGRGFIAEVAPRPVARPTSLWEQPTPLPGHEVSDKAKSEYTQLIFDTAKEKTRPDESKLRGLLGLLNKTRQQFDSDTQKMRMLISDFGGLPSSPPTMESFAAGLRRSENIREVAPVRRGLTESLSIS